MKHPHLTTRTKVVDEYRAAARRTRIRPWLAASIAVVALLAGGCSASGSSSPADTASEGSSSSSTSTVGEPSSSSSPTAAGSLPLVSESRQITIDGHTVTVRGVDVPAGSQLHVVRKDKTPAMYLHVYPAAGENGGYSVLFQKGTTLGVVTAASEASPPPVMSVFSYEDDEMLTSRANGLGANWWKTHDPGTASVGTLVELHRTNQAKHRPDSTKWPLAGLLLRDLANYHLSVDERAAIITVLSRMPDVTLTWGSDAAGETLELALVDGVDDVVGPVVLGHRQGLSGRRTPS